ncbi:MAG: hypothetical protein H7Y86_14665 [Rhizobacter sp.]|nr:hypothetical protein [Ferruginibacter sp.]
MLKKKILFTIGSPNQTTQMHQVAAELPDYDCFFSQLYSNHPLIKLVLQTGLLDCTILSGEFKKKGDAYLRKYALHNDYAAALHKNQYSLVVLCSDMLVTSQLRQLKTVWIQEGMTDPVTNWGKIVQGLSLPSWLAANTAFNGGSNICDIYCAASSGYKKQFAAMGTDAAKIFVTGMPNYDDVKTFLTNDFPYRDYVLAATSDIRETFKKEDREKFIGDCIKIAGGRQLFFKLHPNENKERAIAEIKKTAPSDTRIFTEGNTNHMIANCDELITQYSTVVYVGIALGKKVHSYFDIEELKQLTPIQNNGTSSANIAGLCRNYIEHTGTKKEFLQSQHRSKLQLV